MPSSVVLLAERGDEVIGTVSLVHREHGCKLPLEDEFDLGNRWDFSKRILELTGLAIAPEYRGQAARVLYPLYGLIHHYTQFHCPADVLIFAIHPKDSRFYDQQLLTKPVFDKGPKSKPIKYSNACGAPAVLRYIDLPKWLNEMKESGNRIQCTDALSNSLFRFEPESFQAPVKDPFNQKMSPDDVKYFLGKLKHIRQIKEEHRETLKEAHRFNAFVTSSESTVTRLQSRDQRVDLSAGAEIHFEDSKIRARIENASENGFLAVLDREIPLSLFNILKVNIVAASGITLVARPVWRDGKNVGFTIISENSCWTTAVDKALHQETFNFGSAVNLSRIMHGLDLDQLRVTTHNKEEKDGRPRIRTVSCELKGSVWVDGVIVDVDICKMSNQKILLSSQSDAVFQHGHKYNLFLRYNSGMMLEVQCVSLSKSGTVIFEIKKADEQFIKTLAELSNEKNAAKMSKESFRAA